MRRDVFNKLKAKADALERRITEMEEREAHRLAILAHMRKHRIQTYLRKKLKGAS